MPQATLEPKLLSNDKKAVARKVADFLQIHWLASYPASNPNRDRDGEAKRIVYGLVERGRISSQCLKRTIRTGRIFKEAFGVIGEGYLGARTKELGAIVHERLLAGGVDEPSAEQWTLVLAAVFGTTKPKPKKKTKKNAFDHLKNETMFFISPAEKKALLGYVDRIITEKRVPPAVKGKEELEAEAEKLRPEILKEKNVSVDIALFGRMFAHDKTFSVEACCQVAHAMTVHSMEFEDDAWAAVDDVKESGETQSEDRGSGHLGDFSLGAGLFYNYASINMTALREALGDELAAKVARVFVEACLTEFPRAKGNSCAQQSRAFYGRVERGQKTPRNLMLAFLDPVDRKNVGRLAVDRLREMAKNIDAVYGPCCERTAEFDVLDNKGSMDDLLGLAGAP
jgi:CRISPR system Cascade subunit CasC